jgi:hypothetical protein
MTDTERLMKASLEKRGYAVVAALRPMTVGKLIPAVNVGDERNEWAHPWGVIAETDKADWEGQCACVGPDYPLTLNPAYKFFYRVVTD